MPEPARQRGLAVGDEVEVDVTAIAHGGHCIARHDGQVLFVRHTIPGERVLARVTETGAGERFVRADAVAVLTPSPDRVAPPCPFAGPGLCGGCDLQHVGAARASARSRPTSCASRWRGWPTSRSTSTSSRFPATTDGLDWRTRVEFAVDAEGRAGLRRHRSHDVVAIDHCRIAAPGIDLLRVTEGRWPGVEAVDAVGAVGRGAARRGRARPGRARSCTSGSTPAWRGADGGRADAVGASSPCRPAASGRCTPGAARTFVEAVMDAAARAAGGAGPRPVRRGGPVRGARWPPPSGPTGQVVAVESDPEAAEHARAQPRRPAQRRRADRPGRRRLRGGAPVPAGQRQAAGEPPAQGVAVRADADGGRRRRARPAAHRRRPRRLRRGRGAASARRRLRRLRPGRAGARHAPTSPTWATGWTACGPSTPSR